MERLKTLNDHLWKILLKVSGIYTDNVAIAILGYSILFAGFFSILYVYIFKRHAISFLLNVPYIASVAYMIHRLPMLHPRMHFALKNTSSVILQSEEYQKAFRELSGIKQLTSRTIAEYLYGTSKDFTKTPPDLLYSSLDHVLKKSRCIVGPFEVQEKDLAFSILFLVVCLILFSICCFKKEVKAGLFLILIMASSFINYGTLLCSISVCGFECIYISFFQRNASAAKAEKKGE